MPIINVNNKPLYATYNDNTIDFGASFRRYKRMPLDESSVHESYSMLNNEMTYSKSPIYKGQIISVTNQDVPVAGLSYSPGAPYYIGNEKGTNISYYADRLITNSYFNYVEAAYYVNRYQLGTYYTGVGEWDNITIDPNTNAVNYNAYSEIFNDYVTNSAKGAYSHVEGSGNTATDKATYSHVEGKGNSTDAPYTSTGGLSNVNNGQSSLVNGANNKNTYGGEYSIVSGKSAYNSGSASLVTGLENKNIGGDYSQVAGRYNNNSGDNSK